MGQLKIKDIEGDARDVGKLLRDILPGYLGVKVPTKKIPSLLIGMTACLFFILASCVWIDIFNVVWTKVAILGLFSLYFLLLLMMHNNYKSWSLTGITGLAGVVLILLALNVYPPQEVAKKIEEAVVEKYRGNK